MLKNSFNHIDFLGRALDGSWMRNTAISNNIANINTPGYKKEVVDFETVLKNQLGLSSQIPMAKTDPNHMSALRTENIDIEKITDTRYRVDGSNVDVDVENAELAKNTVYYNSLANEINGQFSRIKTALRISK
ncbi:flagellar basal body rod protein FlgB [Fusibacter paucivorans]|uniref:Flagellar basal body rod protein FlgB n=1 Tax=Fusibacter paucivorans TaxID=76009 RepID=A0ABS5PT86_9FIRM|nr:flagellar basal body rod protein FlgB [Fusibacter paucivorans]MBS7528389.1 flagellar basal body rod protein FlgB [Fusibacter paucivorans]